GLCEIADLREGCRVPLRAIGSRRTADQGQDQKDACRDKVTRALGGGGTFQVQVQCAENLFGEFLRKVSSRESIPRQTKVKEGGRLSPPSGMCLASHSMSPFVANFVGNFVGGGMVRQGFRQSFRQRSPAAYDTLNKYPLRGRRGPG